jgi:CHAT domain-containing protein
VVIADPDYGTGDSFTPLPGTRLEGEGVAALLKASPWLGVNASRSRLLTVRSPIILHIATHGFFLETSDDGQDALERSGLALAGANESTDGLFTAADVALLTLSATELVVLSACETGIGTLLPGEGVFGLRRSFALAGVRTLVMSLWSVPDEITMDLILRFYRFLAAGHARNDALREAQLEIRREHPDPTNWGGFICQGDGAGLKFEWSAS